MKHPEQKENEIYMGNSDGYPSFSSWKTKRVGKIAYVGGFQRTIVSK